MKKKLLYSYIACVLTIGFCYSKNNEHIAQHTTKETTLNTNVVIDSKSLRIFEGKSIGLTHEHIRAKLIIRTQILHMLHGVAKDGKREGLYIFNNEKYTVMQLAELEARNRIDATWIKHVKQEFAKQIQPFLDLGRGFKPQMLIFISESLRLHHRDFTKSILLKWAESNDDMQAFNVYVRSFHDLSEFLYELLNFLDDLISSCPKAKQQFLDNLKTDHEKNMYTQRFNQLLEQQLAKISKYNK